MSTPSRGPLPAMTNRVGDGFVLGYGPDGEHITMGDLLAHRCPTGDLAALAEPELRKRYRAKWPQSVDEDADIPWMLAWFRSQKIALVDADELAARRCAPAPEIVSGEDAAKLWALLDEALPCTNSVGNVRCWVGGGSPAWDRGTAREWCARCESLNPVRRLVVPPAPLAVGDTVETAAQLDTLPDGAVLRGGPQRLVMEKIDTGWWAVGNGRQVTAVDFLPARVLDLPEATS